MLKKLKANHNLLMLALMVILSGGTQVLAIMKFSLVAGFFGTSTDIDAYNFASSVASFVFGFVSAGISTIILPSYVKDKNNKDVYSFLTLIYGLLFLITMGCIIFRIPLISFITKKENEFVQIAARSLIILMLSNFLTSIANITTSFFQCIDKYNTPKIINLLSHLLVVIGLIVIEEITIYQYALMIAAGVVINFVFDTAIAIKHGWRFKLDFHFNTPFTKKLLRMFFPIVLSTGIYRLSLMVDSTMASRLEEGKITILSYSSQIASMVNAIVIGNLLIYLYPKIVARINKKESQTFFWNQSAFIHAIVCLIIAGYFSVGQDGISILFEHGKFTADATSAVFIGSLLYIIGQQANVIRDLIYRYFYAIGNTKIAATNSLIVGITNIVVSLILFYMIGFYGIILGTVVASFTSLVIIMIRFDRLIGYDASLFGIIFSYLRNIMICLGSVAVVLLTKHIIVIHSAILRILVFGMETVVVYCVLTLIFNKKVIKAAKSI